MVIQPTSCRPTFSLHGTTTVGPLFEGITAPTTAMTGRISQPVAASSGEAPTSVQENKNPNWPLPKMVCRPFAENTSRGWSYHQHFKRLGLSNLGSLSWEPCRCFHCSHACSDPHNHTGLQLMSMFPIQKLRKLQRADSDKNATSISTHHHP